jgi:hypothetical protein
VVSHTTQNLELSLKNCMYGVWASFQVASFDENDWCCAGHPDVAFLCCFQLQDKVFWALFKHVDHHGVAQVQR